MVNMIPAITAKFVFFKYIKYIITARDISVIIGMIYFIIDPPNRKIPASTSIIIKPPPNNVNPSLVCSVF
jgi:hypothetical protein